MKNEVCMLSFVGFIKFLLYFLFQFKIVVCIGTDKYNKLHLSHKHPNEDFTDFIIKPKKDMRKYYNYKLPNGIVVYIINDGDTVADGASLTVGSGAGMDKDILGLAHFTEHMLFLGSKKYPNATYFVDYITQHHGSFNGYTALNKTAYYFKIDKHFFEHAMDIFSSVFINPLFNETYIDKEIDAVNSEFEKNLQLDFQRKDHVIRQFASKKSFYSHFRTGNIKTLKNYTSENKINLTEKVRNYFNKFYVPSQMKLIIYGSKAYSHYKSIIESTFAHIPVKRNHTFKFEAEKKLPFEYHKQGFLILYETLKNHKEFEVDFILPDVNKYLPHNPALLIKSLINFKGTGSLFDILRQKGYMSYIKSNLKELYSSLFFFKLQGTITEKGINNLPEVIKIIIEYIEFVKENLLTSDIKEIYENIKKYYSSKFQNSYKKKVNVMKELSSISSDVWNYPKEYLIAQLRLLKDFNKDNLKEFFGYLTLNNSIVLIGDKSFKTVNFTKKEFLKSADQYDFKKIEPYLNVLYSNYYLNIPFMKNIYIDTSKFVFYSHYQNNKVKNKNSNSSLSENNNISSSNSSVNNSESDSKDLTPKTLLQEDKMKVLLKIDKSFQTQKVNIYIQLVFPIDVNDIKFITFIRFFVYSVNHKMRNFFLNMTNLKNSIKLTATPTGILIKVYSNSETIQSIIQDLLKNMKEMKISIDDFKIIKEEMKNQFEGLGQVLPKLKAFVNFFSFVIRDNISINKILEELKNFNLEEFDKMFNKLIFHNLYSRILIYGNIQEYIATVLVSKIKDQLNFNKQIDEKNKLKLINNSKYHASHADLSGYFIYREKNLNKYNRDHAIINFYQIGPDNMKNVIKATMIKEIVGYVYFTELRIKEQLGYSATGKIFSEAGVLYYMILVEGSKATPDVMDEKIENVVSVMKERIDKYSTEQLKNLKKTITRRLINSKDKTLRSRTDYIWNEILNERNNFNLKTEISDGMKNIIKDNIVQFFNIIFYNKLRKLSIQEYSNNVSSIPKSTRKIKRKEGELNFKPVLIDENNLNYFRNNKNKFFRKINK